MMRTDSPPGKFSDYGYDMRLLGLILFAAPFIAEKGYTFPVLRASDGANKLDVNGIRSPIGAAPCSSGCKP